MKAECLSFRAWFEERFGAVFPLDLATDLARTGAEGEHFATEAHENLTPHALMVPAYPETPRTYVVGGVWGHGLSRMAFYFIERTPDGFEAFFRVSFESAYGGEASEEIVAFMRGYAEWRAHVAARLRGGRIEYSMGTGRWEIRLEGDDATRQGRIPLAPNGAVLRPSEMWPLLTARIDAT